jgi:hypothetical protein
MTKKRRRKRPSGGQSATPPAESSGAAAPAEPSSEETTEERPRGAWGGRPSPYPPLGVTLVRGLQTAGGSLPILALTFLASLLAWIGLVAMGLEPGPNVMAQELVLWPLQATGFLPGIVLPDWLFALSAVPDPLGALPLMIGAGAVRSLFLGTILLMIDRRLKGETSPFRAAGPRLAKAVASLLGVYLLEVTLSYLLYVTVLPSIGLQFGVVLSLGGLYFLVMVPVVVVAEDAPAQDSFRRGFRAARLPGTRHLSLVLVYVLFIFAVTTLTARAVLAPATPSFFTWLFVLLASFIHVGVLASLHYRWLAVREEVPAPEPARRPSAGRRPPR